MGVGGRSTGCFCNIPSPPPRLWRHSKFENGGAWDSTDPTCSFWCSGSHYLHERSLCFPGRTQEGNVQGNFCAAGSFIHFSQHRAVGLLLLDETRAHSQRRGEQHTFPSVRQCGILLGKPKFPGAELCAQAVSFVSWEGCRTFYNPLGRVSGGWEEVQEPLCEWGTFPRQVLFLQVVGEENSHFPQTFISRSLSSFGCSSCRCVQKSFVASASCFDNERGKCPITPLLLKNEPFHPKCPLLLSKVGRDGAHLATDSAKLWAALGCFCSSDSQTCIKPLWF